MKRAISMTTLAVLMLTSVGLAAKDVVDMSEAINEFKEIDTVAPFFGSAYAYAVFPTIGKGGLGIGAARGGGQVYKGGGVTGFTSMTNVTIGFQAGGQAYSQVIFFENADSYNAFTSGNFEFKAEAQAIAVQSSAQATASTEGTGTSASGQGAQQKTARYADGLAVFTMAKGGLMYEASIGGQKYSFEAVE